MNTINNKISSFFLGLVVILMSFSCEDDFETVPVEDFTLDFVFSSTDSLGTQAKKYLNTVYSQMESGHNRINPNSFNAGDYLDAASDDAISSSLDQNNPALRLATGRYTAASRVEDEIKWGFYYEGIRTSSTFITNIDRVPLRGTVMGGDGPIPLIRAWKAEAKFIRALHYFELVKRYGGVPLIGDEPRELGDDLELPRNTFEETIDYIVGELDGIKDSLRVRPVANPASDAHVVTKGAALALKTRVLLYAASPLFNGGNIDSGNSLTGYTDYDVNRWQAAADAAREFMNDLSYYSLNGDFANVFITEGNPEVIFFRQEGENTQVELNNGPVGFTAPNDGAGRTSPTQNLVEAFPMLDGKEIGDPTSVYTYDPLNQYDFRDPRLELTILHNNSSWLNTDLETFVGGVNNPNSAIQKTKTSYYLRKFMGEFENTDSYASVSHDWIMFRYAEILLNFAEAQNEVSGPSSEVYQVLIDLRARAGIEPGENRMYGLKKGMNQDQMRKAIHKERRLEMAFEEQRYWDIRRWKAAEEIYSHPFHGLVITRSGPVLNYNVVDVLNPTFETRRYLYPIPYEEVINNDNMVQNPGW